MNARRLLSIGTMAAMLGSCSHAPHERTAVQAAASPPAHKAAATTGLPAVLALDRLPKMHGGFSVDEERAAVGFIGPDRSMIVAAPMSAGGGAGALDVGLFRVTDGQPVFLSDLSVNGGVESVRIDGGRLFVISAAYRGSDRLCCPSGIRTWTYGIIRGAPVLLQSNVTWRSPAVTATVQAAPQRVPATQPPPIAAATRTPLLRSTAPHESPAPPLPSTLPAPAGSDCTPATIYAVAADGSTIDTTDGSVYSVAPAELTISQQWSRGQSVLVCANELINEDRAGQRVGVHSNSTI